MWHGTCSGLESLYCRDAHNANATFGAVKRHRRFLDLPPDLAVKLDKRASNLANELCSNRCSAELLISTESLPTATAAACLPSEPGNWFLPLPFALVLPFVRMLLPFGTGLASGQGGPSAAAAAHVCLRGLSAVSGPFAPAPSLGAKALPNGLSC